MERQLKERYEAVVAKAAKLMTTIDKEQMSVVMALLVVAEDLYEYGEDQHMQGLVAGEYN